METARLLLSVFGATTLSSDQLASVRRQSGVYTKVYKKSGCRMHPKVASWKIKFFSLFVCRETQ